MKFKENYTSLSSSKDDKQKLNFKNYGTDSFDETRSRIETTRNITEGLLTIPIPDASTKSIGTDGLTQYSKMMNTAMEVALTNFVLSSYTAPSSLPKLEEDLLKVKNELMEASTSKDSFVQGKNKIYDLEIEPSLQFKNKDFYEEGIEHEPFFNIIDRRDINRTLAKDSIRDSFEEFLPLNQKIELKFEQVRVDPVIYINKQIASDLLNRTQAAQDKLEDTFKKLKDFSSKIEIQLKDKYVFGQAFMEWLNILLLKPHYRLLITHLENELALHSYAESYVTEMKSRYNDPGVNLLISILFALKGSRLDTSDTSASYYVALLELIGINLSKEKKDELSVTEAAITKAKDDINDKIKEVASIDKDKLGDLLGFADKLKKPTDYQDLVKACSKHEDLFYSLQVFFDKLDKSEKGYDELKKATNDIENILNTVNVTCRYLCGYIDDEAKVKSIVGLIDHFNLLDISTEGDKLYNILQLALGSADKLKEQIISNDEINAQLITIDDKFIVKGSFVSKIRELIK